MTSLRRHIHRYRWLAAALIVAALLIKMLVPTGYMPSMADGTFVMRPCDGQRAGPAMMNATMTSSGHAHAGHDDHRDDGGKHGTFDMPCAFSSLATPSLAAADPILLAIAIAFILASAFRITPAPILWRGAWLRPPSQGPPATT